MALLSTSYGGVNNMAKIYMSIDQLTGDGAYAKLNAPAFKKGPALFSEIKSDKAAALKANPAVSFWLKEALTNLENRDILDAVCDAKVLFDAMNERYTELTGRKFGVSK
jgi:hypothetical protein